MHVYFIKTSLYHGVVLSINYFIIEIKLKKNLLPSMNVNIFVNLSNIILQYASRTSVKLKKLLV
jgi:hypothetical protein